MSAKVQRLRVTFARGDSLKFVGHLDLQRFWERALRRAGLSVSYSEGFSPHPQITLAAPLPSGMTAEADFVDVFLAERVEVFEFKRRLQPQLPAGVSLVEVEEVPVNSTSSQALLRSAEYRADVADTISRTDLEGAVTALMARTEISWHHQREHEVKHFDLRPLIEWIRVGGESPLHLIMRLKAEPGATGRPDHVLGALGIRGAQRICRVRLVLAAQPDVNAAGPTGDG